MPCTSKQTNVSQGRTYKKAISLSTIAPSTRLSRRENFSAAHRLHNPDLSEDQNREIYSKCNNPNGHGHNYVVYTVLKGPINVQTGMVYNLADLKQEIAKVLGNLFNCTCLLLIQFIDF
jgi:6-pyruvoyl tetrahydropterin synthase/QueD family protein